MIPKRDIMIINISQIAKPDNLSKLSDSELEAIQAILTGQPVTYYSVIEEHEEGEDGVIDEENSYIETVAKYLVKENAEKRMAWQTEYNQTAITNPEYSTVYIKEYTLNDYKKYGE